MFNNSTNIQADNSTFINVEGDWQNYHFSSMTKAPIIRPTHLPPFSDRQPQELANWISLLDFNEQQETAFGQHTKGTGTWVLQKPEFVDWRDGKYGVLWCPGKPGVGKTILTSIVIDHLQGLFKTDVDAAVLFIYCNYKMLHNVFQLLEVLLKQLAFHRLTSNSIELLQRDHKERGRRPSLDMVTKILKAEIETYSRVFIVVDALDECLSEQVQGELLERLRSLTTIPGARLMVTSRYIPSIERAVRADVKLEIIAMESDIKSHVEARILKHDMLKRLITQAPSMEEKVVRTIVEKTRGMFLLARLHVDNLADESSRNGILKALEKLPEGFEGTYDDAMERIDQQSKKRKLMAYRVLSWILYAFRPLSLTELRYALAVREDMNKWDENDLDDEDILISVCAGLVTFSEGSRQVSLVHYTTQEYFLKQLVSPTSGPFLSPADLAISCLAHLSLDGVNTLSKNPLLNYAAWGWGGHSRGRDDLPNVMTYAVELLSDDAKVKLVGNIVYPTYWWRDAEGGRRASGLHLCSFFGLKNIAERLLEGGQNPNVQDCDGQNPLHCAAAYGHEPMAKLLLETGQVEVNVRDSSGRTPLYYAAGNGREGVVRLLLEAGQVEPNARDNGGYTPLYHAVDNGREGVVKLLLETRKVDVRDNVSWPLLCHAAWNGYEGVVKLLLEAGKVEDFARDSSDRTPLHCAAQNGHEGVVKLLLNTRKVEVNAGDCFGETPLHSAAIGGHEGVAKLLLETKKIHVNARTVAGETPLHRAACHGHEGMVKLLLETRNVNVDERRQFGRTPLHIAAENGHEGVVKLLLETGKIEVNARDISDHTPLYYAALKGHKEVMKLLETARKVENNGGR